MISWGETVTIISITMYVVTSSNHESIHWLHFTVVMLRMGCLTSRVTKVLTESLLGKVERPIIGVVRGLGRRSLLS